MVVQFEGISLNITQDLPLIPSDTESGIVKRILTIAPMYFKDNDPKFSQDRLS